jgi:hypothetical protein
MSQEVIIRTHSPETALSYRNGNRPSEHYARLSLALPERMLQVNTQADLDRLEAEIDKLPGRAQIRSSGAYYRAQTIAQTRIRTAGIFAFDQSSSIKPLAFGSGMALYFDRRFGFFFCEPNLYRMGDDEISVNLAISTFLLFAPDAMTEKEAKKHIKEFMPIAKTIAEDIQRGHWPVELAGHVPQPCEYTVKIMKFGYDEVDAEMSPDKDGNIVLQYRDEFYAWYGGFRDHSNQWDFSPWEKDDREGWAVKEFAENIPEGPIKRQYVGFLKDIRHLQHGLSLVTDQDAGSKTRH